MSGQKPIVVVGSINMDLVALAKTIPAVGETVIGTDFQVYPGGKGANQAVAVAKLGYPVQLIGRLGKDSFGGQLRTHLERVGVDLTGVAASESHSGVAVIVVSERGENSIVVTPGANAEVTPQDLENHIGIIRGAGMVLAQLEIPIETIESLATLCAREGVPLMLDPAPAAALPAHLFRNIAWFTPNQTEAAFYAAAGNASTDGESPAQIGDRMLSMGCRGVVLKMGADGAFLASAGGLRELIPAFQVKAVDTTAAGDAFNGAFATGIMLGKSPRDSAEFAAAVSAISVTRAGAQPSMPTMAEVDEFLNRHSQELKRR